MVAAEAEVVVREQRLGALVVERRPLELEEDQRGLDLRAALLHQLEQRAALRVGRCGREVQHRVGAGAADELLERRELAHRAGERRPVELGDLPRVGLGERVRALLRVVQQRLDAGSSLARAVQQRVQLPGDPLDLGVGDFFCGHGRRDYDARSPSSISVR